MSLFCFWHIYVRRLTHNCEAHRGGLRVPFNIAGMAGVVSGLFPGYLNHNFITDILSKLKWIIKENFEKKRKFIARYFISRKLWRTLHCKLCERKFSLIEQSFWGIWMALSVMVVTMGHLQRGSSPSARQGSGLRWTFAYQVSVLFPFPIITIIKIHISSLIHYIVEPGNFVGWWVRDNGAFKVNVIPFFEVI